MPVHLNVLIKFRISAYLQKNIYKKTIKFINLNIKYLVFNKCRSKRFRKSLHSDSTLKFNSTFNFFTNLKWVKNLFLFLVGGAIAKSHYGHVDIIKTIITDQL